MARSLSKGLLARPFSLLKNIATVRFEGRYRGMVDKTQGSAAASIAVDYPNVFEALELYTPKFTHLEGEIGYLFDQLVKSPDGHPSQFASVNFKADGKISSGSEDMIYRSMVTVVSASFPAEETQYFKETKEGLSFSPQNLKKYLGHLKILRAKFKDPYVLATLDLMIEDLQVAVDSDVGLNFGLEYFSEIDLDPAEFSKFKEETGLKNWPWQDLKSEPIAHYQATNPDAPVVILYTNTHDDVADTLAFAADLDDIFDLTGGAVSIEGSDRGHDLSQNDFKKLLRDEYRNLRKYLKFNFKRFDRGSRQRLSYWFGRPLVFQSNEAQTFPRDYEILRLHNSLLGYHRSCRPGLDPNSDFMIDLLDMHSASVPASYMGTERFQSHIMAAAVGCQMSSGEYLGADSGQFKDLVSSAMSLAHAYAGSRTEFEEKGATVENLALMLTARDLLTSAARSEYLLDSALISNDSSRYKVVRVGVDHAPDILEIAKARDDFHVVVMKTRPEFAGKIKKMF